MKTLVAALVAVALSSGCASIIKGSSETVTVNSLEKGSVIYVDGSPRGADVASVSVKKGKPHALRVEKEGCRTVSADTGESFDATSLLGIFIDFGIISIPIDLASGAAWKVEPTTYTLSPICTATAAVAAPVAVAQ